MNFLKLSLFALLIALSYCGGSSGGRGGGGGTPALPNSNGESLEDLKEKLQGASKQYFYEGNLEGDLDKEIYLLVEDFGNYGGITSGSKTLRVVLVNETNETIKINFEDFFPETGIEILSGNDKNCDQIDNQVGEDIRYDFSARDYCVVYIQYSPPELGAEDLAFVGTVYLDYGNKEYLNYFDLSNSFPE